MPTFHYIHPFTSSEMLYQSAIDNDGLVLCQISLSALTLIVNAVQGLRDTDVLEGNICAVSVDIYC